MPAATYPAASRHAESLADVAQHYDGFVLDAFGVLNVGETPIPGAVARMRDLAAAGKRLIVLTNAASTPQGQVVAKFQRLGFDFPACDIISSRDVAAAALKAENLPTRWAALAAEGDDFSDLGMPVADAIEEPGLFDSAGGFLFLSSARWTARLQDRLVAALEATPRPVIIANPDLVAPREDGLSVEPGYYGHDIAARTGITPRFFGKPFGAAFEAALHQAGPGRYAMVGDTLHTDILGGRAAGIDTVLITDHGLFAGRNTAPFISRSGIRPDWVVPTT